MSAQEQAFSQRIDSIQQLNQQLVEDLAGLKALEEKLPAIVERIEALKIYYESSWLGDTELAERYPDSVGQHFRTLRPSQYSILGQDTIWDTLTDHREVAIALIRLLVRAI